jgi:hypothetical protein
MHPRIHIHHCFPGVSGGEALTNECTNQRKLDKKKTAQRKKTEMEISEFFPRMVDKDQGIGLPGCPSQPLNEGKDPHSHRVYEASGFFYDASLVSF